MKPAHFTPTENGEFEPTQFAGSHWGDNHLNGPAVVGLAARTLEIHYGSPDFMPTRLTVDLFRAARSVPTSVSPVSCVTAGGCAARSATWHRRGGWSHGPRLLQYRRSTAPPGRLWSVPTTIPFPPRLDDGVQTAVDSDAGDWSRSPGDHQNESRKRFYNSAIDVVAGQPNSQFVRAVMVAEATSLVTNLGTDGVGYINGDLTVGLARLPVGEWIGVQADSHWAADGVAVGTATLFDRSGAFGSGMTTAVANPAAQIDFANDPFPLRIP